MKLYSIKTERMLLSAMLEYSNILRSALPHLVPQSFGSPITREVFERMIVLVGSGKPVPTAKIMAHDPGLSKAASNLLIVEAQDKRKVVGFTKADAEASIRALNYYKGVRVIYESVKRTSKDLSQQSKIDLQQVRSNIQEDLSQMDDEGRGGSTIIIGKDGNLTDKYIIDHLTSTKEIILPTGFGAIDRRIRGWRKGNVILLTALRGEGKSLFAKSLGVNHFYNKRSVCTINMEMEEWEYLVRLFAQESPFTQARLRGGLRHKKNIQKVLATKRKLDAFGAINGCRWTLRTVSNPMYNASTMHAELKYQGYDVIIIDYVNLLSQGDGDLWKSIYDSSQYIKMMAKDLNCLVYLLAQLSDEGRAKYAKALEEAADVWIHWKLDRDDPAVRMHHGKARDYEPFSFELTFDGKNSRFLDTGSEDAEDEKKKKKTKAKSSKRKTPRSHEQEAHT